MAPPLISSHPLNTHSVCDHPGHGNEDTLGLATILHDLINFLTVYPISVNIHANTKKEMNNKDIRLESKVYSQINLLL